MCAPPIPTATVSDCLGRLCQGERGSDTQGRFEPQLVLYAYPTSIASEHATRVASVSCANGAERNRGKPSERDVTRLRGAVFPVLRLFTRQAKCAILYRSQATNRPYAYRMHLLPVGDTSGYHYTHVAVSLKAWHYCSHTSI